MRNSLILRGKNEMIKKYIKIEYQASRKPPTTSLPKFERPSRPGSGVKDNSNLYKIFGIGENPPPTSQGPGFNNSDKERITVLVQALRLTLRHIEGKSGLNKDEFRSYIETLLKVY